MFVELVLKPKLVDGRLGFFIKANGEMFIVRVGDEERLIPRDHWRSLTDCDIKDAHAFEGALDLQTSFQQ